MKMNLFTMRMKLESLMRDKTIKTNLKSLIDIINGGIQNSNIIIMQKTKRLTMEKSGNKIREKKNFQ